MSLPEGTSKFKEIERKVQGICFQLGREALATILEDWDKEIMHSRDKEIYRHVGKKQTTIKTVIGEVEYQRVQYEYISEEGVKSYVYLLDETMGIDSGGLFSELMRELIVESCCASPYREAARTIRDMTGQTISHMATWSVVQAVGEQVGEDERRAAEKAVKSEGVGTIAAKVVFEEQDGISLSLQGKSRKEYGERKEMKVAIAYDGAVKKGKKRYILTNKVACASFEGVDEFEKRKEGVIASVYNVDEVIMRFLNGDGANWIRRSQTDETVHFQLDPFHRNKAVTECVTNEEARVTIMEARRTMDIDLLLHVIEVEAASTDDEKEREGYLKLYSYYNNNRDGLVPYYRRGLDIPEPPEGKEYRRMGAMESNVYTLIGNRMKGGRANWSIDGGNNLARLLCRKHTGRLRGVLDSLSAVALPERYAEEVAVEMSAAKSPQREGKGYDGFHQAMIPSTQKWLKSIAAIKPVYSI